MSVYKRSDWNDLLDSVNNVLQNPPEDGDCEPIDPIPHVGLKHRWSKDDIREVQDKLRQTCEDITFDEIPDLWKQSIIDDINEALGEAWCDCECGTDPIPCEFGQTYAVIVLTPTCDFDVSGFGNCRWDFAPIINGMQVAEPGFRGRSYQLIRRNKYTGELATSVFPGGGSLGIIDCDGRIVCTADTSGTNGARFTDDGPGFGPAHFFDLRLRCDEFSELSRVQYDCCEDEEDS